MTHYSSGMTGLRGPVMTCKTGEASTWEAFTQTALPQKLTGLWSGRSLAEPSCRTDSGFSFLKSVNIVTDVVIIIIQMIVNIAIQVLFHLDWATNKCSCQGVFIGNGFRRSDLLLLPVLNDLISAFIKNSLKIIVTINILIIEDVFSSSIYSLSNTCN